jgi:hypothetical protein
MRFAIFASVLSISLIVGAMPAAAQTGLVPGVTAHGPGNGALAFYPDCCTEHNVPVRLKWFKRMPQKDHAKLEKIFDDGLQTCRKNLDRFSTADRDYKIGMAYCMSQLLRQSGLDYVQAEPDPFYRP